MAQHLQCSRSWSWLGAAAALLLAGVAFLGCKDKVEDGGDGKENPGVMEVTHRQQSSKNLMQLAMAMHDYHNDNLTLPPHALYSKEGRPLLSWRVMMLPYLKQQDLYRQFKLDEPWDGPTNKKLLAQMPKVFAAPGVEEKEPRMTRYQVFVSEPTSKFRSLFARAMPPGQQPPKLGLERVTSMDGTSNTIMIIEAANPVPWTKPEDLAYDDARPVPQLGFFTNRIHAAFADGSIRELKKDPDEKALRLIITYNDGEIPKEDIFFKGLFSK